MFLAHVRGPRGYDNLRTVKDEGGSDKVCSTLQEACKDLGATAQRRGMADT
jgi:hypothetical protein